MNIVLWVFQVILALHTAMGAIWKFSKSAEETMPSLKAIPQPVWLGMGGVELLCALALVVPAFYEPAARLAPIAAILIAVEMVALSAIHLSSGDGNYGSIAYWLVVAGVSSVIAYCRF